MAGVDVEFKLVRSVLEHPIVRNLVLQSVRGVCFGLLHLFTGREIRAVLVFEHVDGDVDHGLEGRGGSRDRQTHRYVKHVLAVQREPPHETKVLLSGVAEAVVIGRKRHREQCKQEEQSGNAKVEKHVPASFFQARLTLFERHLLHGFVLVLVQSQCTRCVGFVFGHVASTSPEHFKSATREFRPDGNRWNQKDGQSGLIHDHAPGRSQSRASALQHAAHR